MEITLFDRLKDDYKNRLRGLELKHPRTFKKMSDVLTSKKFHSDITIGEAIMLLSHLSTNHDYRIADIQEMFMNDADARKRKEVDYVFQLR